MRKSKVFLNIILIWAVGFGLNIEIENYHIGLIRDIAISKDEIWIAREDDVAKIGYNGNVIKKYTKEDGIQSDGALAVAIDNQGNPWFATGGLSTFDGQKWTNYTVEDGLVDGNVLEVAVDKENKIWAGTYTKGIGVFDGKNWDTIDVSDGICSNHVICISFNGNGNTWVGTWGEGASKFSNDKWTSYRYVYGNGIFVGPYLYAISFDDAGQIWFGSDGVSGSNFNVGRYDGQNWKSYNFYSSTPIVPSNVRAIKIDKNNIKWIGTIAGVYFLTGEYWDLIDDQDGLIDTDVKSMAIDDSGNVWVGTWGGMSKIIASTISIKEKKVLNKQTIGTKILQSQIYGSFKIQLTLPESQDIEITLLSPTGKYIEKLFKGFVLKGENEIDCKSHSCFATGAYLIKVDSNKFGSIIKKTVLIK